ncbi:MAG: hypothetical protein COZ12_08050, partial [Deltaproteobacteria bacterium CG_4_10_14_3_um_filter_60_8]
MADESNVTAKEAYEIADSFAQASARMLDFRIANSNVLSDEDASKLERCEDTIDHLVVLFRGYGIRLIGAKAREAMVELQAAVDVARLTIEKINKTKKVIKIAGALVDLAVAV